MCLVYINTYATPSILHGAELGELSSETLDLYQSWALSEALGLGRGGKSQGLMEGEVRRLCLYIDTNGPTWSQIRSRNAKVTYRSIMRMENDSLPKTLMIDLGTDNILVTNMVKKLGGGKVTELRMKSCLFK